MRTFLEMKRDIGHGYETANPEEFKCKRPVLNQLGISSEESGWSR